MVFTTSTRPDAVEHVVDYLEGMPAFAPDCILVVEGVPLPCHMQVMAVQSKVFAGMADLTAKLRRDGPTRMEQPFKGKRLSDMKLLMNAIYRPESQELEGNYQAMGVLLALAHEYDMPALTLRIKRMLLPPCDFLEGVSKIGSAPANIDAALTWLQHCQRFSLTDAVPGCEMAVACHFLWAGRFRATEMQNLSSASLFRISQAYARMQYGVSIKHPGLDYTTENGEYHIFQADRHVAEALYHYPLRRPL